MVLEDAAVVVEVVEALSVFVLEEESFFPLPFPPPFPPVEDLP